MTTITVTAVEAQTLYRRVREVWTDPTLRAVHHDHVVARAGWRSVPTVFDSPAGMFIIERCLDCPLLVASCEHTHCGTDPDRTSSTCDLCGGDLR